MNDFHPVSIPTPGKRWPALLLVLFLLETILLAIHPFNRDVWLAENLTALIPAAALVLLYCFRVRFSDTAYTLMALWFLLHMIGGHYTFERVPFDWITDLFGFARNNFDRVCHFLVGTFAFAALEFSDRHRIIRGRFAAGFLVVMAVFGFAAIFELIEWLYAEISNPTAGAAFLGSQGDPWDAQKDMLSDGLGAICCTLLYAWLRWRPRENRNHSEA